MARLVRSRPTPTSVYVETGGKRVFACAVDWPGWCRVAKSEDLALETLAAYAPRYAPVAERAGIRFPTIATDDLVVVERVAGSTTTDFGVPGSVTKGDARPIGGEEAERVAALVEASWRTFDEVVAGAPPELRKGPRGGGRDRDRIVEHVLGAEVAYARKLGLRHRQPDRDDTGAIAALRSDILQVLRSESKGEPVVEKGWPVRYAARRVAWHVLDHAWEIEDRSEPSQ